MRNVLAVVSAFVVAVLLVFVTASIGDMFDLPYFNSWAVAHDTGFLLFPMYFVAALFVLRRAFGQRPTPGGRGQAA